MWCTPGGILEFMIYGRNARNKWAVTKTAATKDIRLKKKLRIIIPTTSAEKLRIMMSITSAKKKINYEVCKTVWTSGRVKNLIIFIQFIVIMVLLLS